MSWLVPSQRHDDISPVNDEASLKTWHTHAMLRGSITQHPASSLVRSTCGDDIEKGRVILSGLIALPSTPQTLRALLRVNPRPPDGPGASGRGRRLGRHGVVGRRVFGDAWTRVI